MMDRAQIETLLRNYHRAWAAGDTDALAETLHADFVTFDLVTGERRDREWELNSCRTWHSGFSDSTIAVEQIIVEGDRAAVYWTLRAVHDKSFVGIEPTSKDVVVPGMETHRLTGGKIAETWRLSDTYSLMNQLRAT